MIGAEVVEAMLDNELLDEIDAAEELRELLLLDDVGSGEDDTEDVVVSEADELRLLEEVEVNETDEDEFVSPALPQSPDEASQLSPQ